MNKAIWSVEATELENLYKTLNDNLPSLSKEVEPLIKTNDANVVLLYARRSLEVIVTELCENELKRPRKTEPLKGIIDKLNSEDKVPSYIITSMHSLNSLATFGTHPKDFDPEQVKPVLINLSVVIKWYLKFKRIEIPVLSAAEPVRKDEAKDDDLEKAIRDGTLRVGKGAGAIAIATKSHWKKALFPVAIFGIILVIAFLIVTPLLKRKLSPEAAESVAGYEKSIAVLPFINDSPDQENTYFINGVMEEILNNLQKIKDLRVISRTSVEKYRGQNKSISEIAEELGVNYIVEGSGQKYGNVLRLRAQLIMAKHESHLWGESFQQKITEVEDIFNIQTKIAESIAAELKAVMSPEEKQRIEKIPTTELAAYDAYLKGQFYWRKLTQNDLQTAMRYFDQAKKIDPEYALAYAGICDGWMGLQQMGIVSPAEAVPNAEAAIMKALELDSTKAEVMYSLALMKTWGKWDWKGGESAFKKAIAINPNFSVALAYYSHLLNILGRSKEAMRQIETALSLDPINPLIKSAFGIDLLFERRYDDAILAFQDALIIDPTQRVAINNLPTTLHLVGRDIEALEAYKSQTKNSEIVEAYNVGYTKAGFSGAIRQVADLLELLSKTTYIRQTDIAYKYALSGDIDKAIKWLENGFQHHDPNLPYLLLPKYDNLRDDSRFQDLCRRLNIPYK